MSEWTKYNLKDITTKIGSGATPTGGGNSYKLEGISLIRSQNILDFKFSHDGLAFIDDKQANELRNVTIKENDVLINITGDSVARVCKVPVQVIPARVNQHVSIIRSDNTKTSSDFLLYSLQHIKDYLLIISEIGGTRNALTKKMLEDLEIDLPPLVEQNEIAEVLCSLDDKINLLHRQNNTLEAIAETLFRQWFVEEADESWAEVTLKEIASHSKLIITPSKNPNSIFKHYSLPAFDQGKEPALEIGKEILSGKYQVSSNSILVSKLNPRTPRIWSLFGEIDEVNAVCSTEFQIVKPKQQKYFSFIYFFLKSYQVTSELIGAASGTSGSHQRVNPQDIFNLSFALPSEKLILIFAEQIEPSLNKIKINTKQINTLTRLRDTLLPKLMSGEVRVR